MRIKIGDAQTSVTPHYRASVEQVLTIDIADAQLYPSHAAETSDAVADRELAPGLQPAQPKHRLKRMPTGGAVVSIMSN
jgi:hypothetical protein